MKSIKILLQLLFVGLVICFSACQQNKYESKEMPIEEAPEEAQEEALTEEYQTTNEGMEQGPSEYSTDWYQTLGEQKVREFFELATLAVDPNADADMRKASREAMETMIPVKYDYWLDEFLGASVVNLPGAGEIKDLEWVDLGDNFPKGYATFNWIKEERTIPVTLWFSTQIKSQGEVTLYTFSIDRIELPPTGAPV